MDFNELPLRAQPKIKEIINDKVIKKEEKVTNLDAGTI
jgi:hypothetical protein